jgi:ABC-type multidrug transport system fused ATPase/permease subunit
VTLLHKFIPDALSENLRGAGSFLTPRDRRRITFIGLTQVFLSLFDLLGVALIGVIGALTVNGINSRAAGDRVSKALDFLQLGGLEFQTQVASLALIACLVLVVRTLISFFLTKSTFRYLSRKSANATVEIYSKILSSEVTEVKDKTSQQTLFALNHGMDLLFLGILATGLSAATDAFLVLVLFAALMYLDMGVALSAFVIFGLVLGFSYKFLQNRANQFGREDTKLSVLANTKVIESLQTYREAIVTNRRLYYIQQLDLIKKSQSLTKAELTFLPYISKYVIEVTIIVGILVVSGIQFLLKDSVNAIATLSVFIAATSRIGPAAMRVQQALIQIKASVGLANPTLSLIDEYKNREIPNLSIGKLETRHLGFNSEIKCSGVYFSYPHSDNSALIDINLTISPGEYVAIVGESGAGKTTFVDVLLGILKPTIGFVEIAGEPPLASYSKWPGAVAYVPQDVVVIEGSVKANIALGLEAETIPDELFWRALDFSQLKQFVQAQADGLNTHIGVGGIRLSGGQRQRIGIARALLSEPKVLVLDEATSSMDGKTESDISNALTSLNGRVTTIVIAHRLSTIRSADRVVFMREGRVVSSGNFDELRRLVPDFDIQARLMGL